MKNPCMNCPDVGCGSYHDQCLKYQEFRKANLKDYERRVQKSNEKYDQVMVNRMHIKRANDFRNTK